MELTPLIFEASVPPKGLGQRALAGAALRPRGQERGGGRGALGRQDPGPDHAREFGPRQLGASELWKAQPERFPLLLKRIEADDDLSVQVHPNDEQAAAMVGPGERGKSEMWVLLSAQPGAQVSVGLKPGVDAAAFKRALATGGVESLAAHRFSVEAGDVIDIPAGLRALHRQGLCGGRGAAEQRYHLPCLGFWPLRERPAQGLASGRGPAGDRFQPGHGRPAGQGALIQAQDLGWAHQETLVNGPFFEVRRLRVSRPGRLSLSSPAPQVLLPLDADLHLDGWGPTGMIVPQGRCALVPACLSPSLEPVGSTPVTVLWSRPKET